MTKDLTKGSVLKNLIYFSLPYLLSSFLQVFYGIADLFIAGQFNGADTITAISTGSQIMHMITVIIVGLAMGTTVMISQAIGGNHRERAQKVIGNSVSLFMVVALFMTGILLVCINGIIKVMAVPDAAIEQAKTYLIICFVGIPFITAYNIISCILRGLGDSRTPMYFIAIACVVNVLMDYVLMGPFHLGAAGAALGTVVSQTISVICALIYLKKKDMGFHVLKEDYKPDPAIISQLLRIGIPISLQDGLIQVSFIIITIIANGRGLIIAASVGIVEKIISFLFLIPSTMLSSISAIAAQNIGAGESRRARRTLGYGICIVLICGLIFSVICQIIPESIIELFSDDADVIYMGADYLCSYVFDCAIAGVHFCFSGFFCAYGRSMISFIHNISAIIFVRIPGAYLASKYYPNSLFEMGMAAPLGSLLSALICIGVYIYLRRKKLV